MAKFKFASHEEISHGKWIKDIEISVDADFDELPRVFVGISVLKDGGSLSMQGGTFIGGDVDVPRIKAPKPPNPSLGFKPEE